MLKFNTNAGLRDRLHLSLEQVFKGSPRIPRTLKTGLLAAIFLCCFSSPSLYSQCNPDITPPTAICVGPYMIALDGTGQAGIDPDDIDNGSFDGCGAVTLAVSPNLLTCADLGGNTITLTVTDLSGNTNTCTTTVTVEDNLPPVPSCPNDITVECDVFNPMDPSTSGGSPTVSDNCDPNPTILPYTDVITSYTADNCKTIERTWDFVDAEGNTSTCTQIITIEDNSPPVFTGFIPTVAPIECDEMFPPTPSISFTDNCQYVVLNNDIDGQDPDPSVCGHYEYTYIRVWDAWDSCNIPTSVSQVIDVYDGTPPSFAGEINALTLPASASCTTFVSLVVDSDDNCAADQYLTNTYEVYQNVPWTLIDSGNGLDASGNYLPGNYTVIFYSEDPCTNEGVHSVDLSIVDNIPPTAICNSLLITVSIPPTGTATLVSSQVDNGSYDNCSPVTFDISPNAFDCSDVGGLPEIVTLTVFDANMNSATCTAAVAVVDNSPPAMLCQNITRTLMADGTRTVDAMEIDGGSFDLCGIDFYEISKDGGATFAPSTTFFCPEVGVNPVILRITDDAGNQGICPATVTIVDDISPTASCSAETVYLDQSGMFMIDSLQFDSTKSNDTNFIIPDSGPAISTIEFFGTGVIKDVNVLNMDIDHSRVGDLSFVLTSPSGTMVTLGDRPGVPASFLGCTSDDILASFDDSASSPSEAFENSCDGTPPAIQGTFQPIDPLSAFNGEDVDGVWTLTVTDNNGAFTTSGFIDSWSLQINYQRWGDTQIGYGSTDNCCAALTDISQTMFTCDDIDTNPNIGGNQPVVYTLTVTDPSGNTDQCTSTITVLDTIRPMITCTDTISLCLDADGIGKIYPDSLLNGGIYISSGNDNSGNSGIKDFCFTATNAITFSFDWYYQSNNSHAGWDPFGYSVNGSFQQLTSGTACTFSGSLTQNGTTTVVLNAGDEFCFEAHTCDNIGGNAEIWIKNMSETFTGNFAMSNWSSKSSDGLNGKAFFVDASGACGTIDYQVTLDSMTWQDCDSLFCDSLDAYVDAWIRAVDPYGNVSDTCKLKLHVEDKEAPNAACTDFTIALNGNGEALVSALNFENGSIDNCDPGPLDFMISTVGITGPYYPSILFDCDSLIGVPIPIFFKATDNYGNSGFCLATLTLQENLSPVITCPPAASISCELAGNSPPVAITGSATAIDNCDGAISTYIFSESPAPNGADCLTFTRTWAATDAAGNTSICGQMISIFDNTNPVLSGVPTFILPYECDPPNDPVVTASDNCDATPTLTSTRIDSRFNYAINPPVGVNMYTPAQSEYYNYTVTWTWMAQDNCSNSTTASRTATVQDSQGPVFTADTMVMFGNDPGQCSRLTTIDLSNDISDNCADYAYLTVEYRINGGAWQSGASFTNTFNVGTHAVEFRADDPSNITSWTYFTLTVVIKDNETPTPICVTGPIPLTLNSNGIATITPATVNNGSNDNCFVASLDVSPALFDCNTFPNPHTVTLTVTDAAGNFNTCTTTVIITNVSAPAIVGPLDITVECQDFDENDPSTSGGGATATTACGPVTPTYSDVTLSGLGDCRVIERTWSAMTAGGTATYVQIITVEDNDDPVLSPAPIDVTVDCNSIPAPATLTATDNCDPSPTITFMETENQDPDPGTCDHYTYEIFRDWTATDDCGNTDFDSQTIFVVDDDDPVVNIPDPLIIGTDDDECFATVSRNLLNYITDCADDAFLTITNSALGSYGTGNGTDNINGVYLPGDYPITGTVTDPCGNSSAISFTLSVRDLEAPQAVCSPAETLILDGSGNGSLLPADIDDGSTDNCGITSMSLSPNTFNTGDVGVVNVVLTVEDAQGNTSMCTTPVTVIERGTVSADNATGAMNDTISVPISVTGFDNICALSFSIELTGSAGNITGVSGFNLPGMTALDFSIVGNDIVFSWVSGTPVTVMDSSAIFNVDVQLTGMPDDVSDLLISGPIMARCDLSTVPITAIDGSATVIVSPSNITLSGTIQNENGANVELVNVSMAGSINSNQTTGTTGMYSFTVPAGSSETITPSKDINDCNGINVLDVLAIQLHILNSTLLPTPYRRIAADVNNDGALNVLDRLGLHLIVLAGNPCIGLSGNTSWRFVPSNYVFPDPLDPFTPAYPESISYTNEMSSQVGDFIGIKIGDLDLTSNPANINGEDDERADGTLYYSIDDQEIWEGNEYKVSFKAKDFADLSAYQFTLGFDANILQFKEVEIGNLPELSEQHFNFDLISEGLITSIWYNPSPTTLADDDTLFTFVFDATANGGQLSNLLRVVSDPVSSEAYDNDLTKLDIDLIFESVTNVFDVKSSSFKLFQNRPNPFGNKTLIPFYLQNASYVTLSITDVSGKTVKVLNGEFGSGNHLFELYEKDLPSSGVFFYTLETNAGKAVKRMILLD